VRGRTTKQKKREDFLAFMDSIVQDYPKTQQIHVIADNHSIHKNIDEWLARNKTSASTTRQQVQAGSTR